jgi:hypothetical protein
MGTLPNGIADRSASPVTRPQALQTKLSLGQQAPEHVGSLSARQWRKFPLPRPPMHQFFAHEARQRRATPLRTRAFSGGFK